MTNENEVRHCIVKYAGRLYGKKSLSVLKKKKVGVQQTPQGHHQKAVNQGDKTRKAASLPLNKTATMITEFKSSFGEANYLFCFSKPHFFFFI